MSESAPAMRPIEGVLLLVDLCGSTAAQSQHGSPAFQAFRAPVRQALVSLEKATGFHLLEDGGDQGDGFMLFRKHEPNASHEELITLFSEMQRKAPQLSTPQFDCALRYVAHFSAFQAHADAQGWPSNIQSTEAVRVFRAEKLANPGDLLITHELALRLHDAPERRGCKIETLRYDRPLKGLELLGANTTVFYRLRLPRQTDAVDLLFPLHFRECRRNLGEECRLIHVFGKVFPSIGMDDNFIQLKLDPVSRRAGGYEEKRNKIGKLSEFNFGKSPTNQYLELIREETGDAEFPSHKRFTPAELHREARHGVILGLPGAGKTTMLRYLVHVTLEKEPISVLLFAASGACTQAHADRCPYDQGTCYSAKGALRLLLATFLWPGGEFAGHDPGVLDSVTAQFHAAWEAHEATVLLDALDEALSPQLRLVLIEAARALFNTLDPKSCLRTDEGPTSRIFVTARRQFRQEIDLETFSIFDVQPLELGDLQQLARSIYDPLGKRQLADRFVAELPYQPAAVKLGGTPMMALLLLFYFDRLQGWASRYHTYDALLRFVLLEVWRTAKQTAWTDLLNRFFAEADDAAFAARQPEAAALYDALSWIGWSALYGDDPTPIRRLTKHDLLAWFNTWLENHPDRLAQSLPPGLAPPSDDFPSRIAKIWFDRLHTAALFIQDDSREYVFLHSTVLEFLAARHLLHFPEIVPAALARPERETLETFPMLCSRDWEAAHELLLLLPRHAHAYQPDSVLAFSCLAETEDAEVRALDQFRAEAHRRPLRERMNSSPAPEPIYKALGAILWTESRDILISYTEIYSDLLPLKRTRFPARWCQRIEKAEQAETWFTSGFLRKDRQAFLETILNKNLHHEFITEIVTANLTGGGFFEIVGSARMDRSDYFDHLEATHDPEFIANYRQLRLHCPPLDSNSVLGVDQPDLDHDQNLAYYRAAYTPAICGFLGSPNFRINTPWFWFGTIGFALSPNGKILATCAESTGRILLWHAATGRELRSLTGHTGYVMACAWDPSGQFLASASYDQTVRIWDAAAGREIRSLSGHSASVWDCSWHPSGKWIAAACEDHTVRIWDVATGRELHVLAGHSARVWACAWDPSGQRIASASSDQTVRIWNAHTGIQISKLAGRFTNAKDCEWDLGGQRIAAACDDKTVRLWEASTEQEIEVFMGHSGGVGACAWDPTGKLIASASDDNTLRIWDTASGHGILTLSGHSDRTWACAWAPSGSRLYSAASDNTVRVWNAASGSELRVITGHCGRVMDCAWDPSGNQLASTSSDGTVRSWDASSGHEILVLSGHNAGVLACAWDSTSQRLATASNDNTIRIWNAITGLEHGVLIGHSSSVNACAWDASCQRLASASSDNTVRLWDVASGRELMILANHSGKVRDCVWDNTGLRLASASNDGSIILWEIANGRALFTLHGHSDWVLACAWNPSGNRLISASNDQTLRLWDTTKGITLLSLTSHSASVNDCTWNPNGDNFASASSDKTVRLWEMETGKELHCFQLPSEALSVDFHPGGHSLAVGLASGISVILDLRLIDPG